MKHSDAVRKIYRDFAAGDAAAILAAFADDIEFKLTEHHPYRGPAGRLARQASDRGALLRRRRAGMGRLDDRRRSKRSKRPTPSSSKGRYTGLYKPTGRRMDVQVCHVWRFRGDRVASFHQYVDTAALRRIMARDGTADA